MVEVTPAHKRLLQLIAARRAERASAPRQAQRPAFAPSVTTAAAPGARPTAIQPAAAPRTTAAAPTAPPIPPPVSVEAVITKPPQQDWKVIIQLDSSQSGRALIYAFNPMQDRKRYSINVKDVNGTAVIRAAVDNQPGWVQATFIPSTVNVKAGDKFTVEFTGAEAQAFGLTAAARLANDTNVPEEVAAFNLLRAQTVQAQNAAIQKYVFAHPELSAPDVDDPLRVIMRATGAVVPYHILLTRALTEGF